MMSTKDLPKESKYFSSKISIFEQARQDAPESLFWDKDLRNLSVLVHASQKAEAEKPKRISEKKIGNESEKILPTREEIKDFKTLSQRLSENKGQILFYSGKLEHNLLTKFQNDIFVFGDNANRANALGQQLFKSAILNLSSHPSGSEIDIKILELRMDLNPQTSVVAKVPHFGGGQAKILKSGLFTVTSQKYRANALGIPTCDAKNSTELRTLILRGFELAQKFIDRHDSNIVIPVLPNTHCICSLGKGRAIDGNRQHADFNGEAVCAFIEEQINLLEQYANEKTAAPQQAPKKK